MLPSSYITHNATVLLSGIPGGDLSDSKQLLLEPQKASRHCCQDI